MNTTQYPGLLPSYEHERLAALQPYQVLGTPGQEVFNDFVSIVAKLFDMPIALVSLVRADDVVFIGQEGLPEALSVPREDSMCSVAILSHDLTEFRDVVAAPCTLVNPYVAQQLHLGFYAGQALRSPEGQPLGSLCVIDRRPRQLTPSEGKLLKDLAQVAQELLRLQAALATGLIVSEELRTRLDATVQQSLTRLATLAELRQWETAPDTADTQRYVESRLDEARFLAQTLNRELKALLG
ncbi:GAF domain-containing protein [Hymenobacter sp. DH14]|uniref:GAF domain-containing protein n=1 Tax=Hymenobacter cyanobacteriorum TaxID=2926463 RepID=A0A9X1VEQ7_9BACT|nr:GAF domain-containing protein [Hymenobacter cyanobacteriorum]MCI1187200.1 GAF domain-containing protein [Hymenobacter cyanobacteriorum]